MNATAVSCGKAVRAFYVGLADNPVLVKEFRTRMRGARAFYTMGAYVLLLSIVALVVFGSAVGTVHSTAAPRIGRQLFSGVIWVQTILLVLFVPALASGTLSREVEKKTIELLALTSTSPSRIVFGKFASGFLYLLVLVLCSVPLAGLSVMLGGISPYEIAGTYAALISLVFLLISASVFWSSLFNKTVTASVFSYGVSIVYLVGMLSLLPLILYGSIHGSSGPAPFLVGFLPGIPLLGGSQVTAEICGVSLPLIPIACVYQVLLGTLLLYAAVMHVRHKKADKSRPVRLLLMAVSAISAWLIIGDTMTGPSYWSLETIEHAAMGVFMLLVLFVPIMATGTVDMAVGELTLRYAWAPSRMFKPDIRGAVPFMSLWTLVLCTAVGGTGIWTNTGYGTPIPPIPAIDFAAMWLCVTVVLIIALAALCYIGILASSVAKTREQAAGIIGLMMALIAGIYIIS